MNKRFLNHRRSSYLCSLGLASAALLLSSASLAESIAVKPSTAWLKQHLQELRTSWPQQGSTMAGQVKFVFGNEVWQPGQQFSNGTNWLALSCTPQACELEPAVLQVKRESWQGHYDDSPTAGQQLRFKRTKLSAGKVVVWFQTVSTSVWLNPRAVPTYYSAASHPKQPNTPGTLETLIELPGGATATLVPMLLQQDLKQQVSDGDSQASFLLQLRANGKRQFLLSELGNCSRAIDRRYLQWAGDLDGDGKPDYLISFIDADGPVHLYLSGQAKPGQLVGLAGLYISSPWGGECDGNGWL